MKAVPTADEDPYYQEFLAEQKEREAKWSANREASTAKKASEAVVSEPQAADEVGIITLKQQLEAKNRECALLMDQLLGQKRLCKVSTFLLYGPVNDLNILSQCSLNTSFVLGNKAD